MRELKIFKDVDMVITANGKKTINQLNTDDEILTEKGLVTISNIVEYKPKQVNNIVSDYENATR